MSNSQDSRPKAAIAVAAAPAAPAEADNGAEFHKVPLEIKTVTVKQRGTDWKLRARQLQRVVAHLQKNDAGHDILNKVTDDDVATAKGWSPLSEAAKDEEDWPPAWLDSPRSFASFYSSHFKLKALEWKRQLDEAAVAKKTKVNVMAEAGPQEEASKAAEKRDAPAVPGGGNEERSSLGGYDGDDLVSKGIAQNWDDEGSRNLVDNLVGNLKHGDRGLKCRSSRRDNLYCSSKFNDDLKNCVFNDTGHSIHQEPRDDPPSSVDRAVQRNEGFDLSPRMVPLIGNPTTNMNRSEVWNRNSSSSSSRRNNNRNDQQRNAPGGPRVQDDSNVGQWLPGAFPETSDAGPSTQPGFAEAWDSPQDISTGAKRRENIVMGLLQRFKEEDANDEVEQLRRQIQQNWHV